MTNIPIEDQARALAGEMLFCEFLDACHPLISGWPHSRTSARCWLEMECGVDSLGHLRLDPEAAVAFEQIAEQFAQWDRKGG